MADLSFGSIEFNAPNYYAVSLMIVIGKLLKRRKNKKNSYTHWFLSSEKLENFLKLKRRTIQKYKSNK